MSTFKKFCVGGLSQKFEIGLNPHAATPSHKLWVITGNKLDCKIQKRHCRLYPWSHMDFPLYFLWPWMSLDLLSDFMCITFALYFPVDFHCHRHIRFFPWIGHCQLSRTRLRRTRRDWRRRTGPSVDQSSPKYKPHLWPRGLLSIGYTLFDFKFYFDNLDHCESCF